MDETVVFGSLLEIRLERAVFVFEATAF